MIYETEIAKPLKINLFNYYYTWVKKNQIKLTIWKI